MDYYNSNDTLEHMIDSFISNDYNLKYIDFQYPFFQRNVRRDRHRHHHRHHRIGRGNHRSNTLIERQQEDDNDDDDDEDDDEEEEEQENDEINGIHRNRDNHNHNHVRDLRKNQFNQLCNAIINNNNNNNKSNNNNNNNNNKRSKIERVKIENTFFKNLYKNEKHKILHSISIGLPKLQQLSIRLSICEKSIISIITLTNMLQNAKLLSILNLYGISISIPKSKTSKTSKTTTTTTSSCSCSCSCSNTSKLTSKSTSTSSASTSDAQSILSSFENALLDHPSLKQLELWNIKFPKSTKNLIFLSNKQQHPQQQQQQQQKQQYQRQTEQKSTTKLNHIIIRSVQNISVSSIASLISSIATQSSSSSLSLSSSSSCFVPEKHCIKHHNNYNQYHDNNHNYNRNHQIKSIMLQHDNLQHPQNVQIIFSKLFSSPKQPQQRQQQQQQEQEQILPLSSPSSRTLKLFDPKLIHLTLRCCQLNDQGCQIICQTMIRNQSNHHPLCFLQSLDLLGNRLTDISCTVLSKTLLTLQNQQFRQQLKQKGNKQKQQCYDYDNHNHNHHYFLLKKLSLSGNDGITIRGCATLLDMLSKNYTIQELGISTSLWYYQTTYHHHNDDDHRDHNINYFRRYVHDRPTN